MRIKLFLHDDYDAGGCAILCKLVCDKVDVEFHNYSTIDLRLKYFIKKKEYLDYDLIIMADISIENYTANLIDKELISNYKNFFLLDHHESSIYLNRFSWAYVSPYINEDFSKKYYPNKCDLPKTCGTVEVYKFLKLKSKLFGYSTEILDKDSVKILVESVRLYDNWYWVDAEPGVLDKYMPYEMNTLYYAIGKQKFIDNMVEKITVYDDIFLYDYEKIILEVEANNVQRYVKAKNKALMKKKIQGYTAGIVFAESYISELGMHLMELNPDIDFVAIIYMPHKVSFRTNKPNINVLEIAKLYGGGGHPQASGCNISKKIIKDFTSGIFNISKLA